MEKLRFGMSSCDSQDLTEKDFKNFADAGVKELELSFSEDRYDTLRWQEIKQRADQYGIHLWSFHLPFSPFSKINMASPEGEMRCYTLSYFEGLMQKAADIGIKNIVVHPSGEPYQENERAERIKWAQESLEQLARTARRLGVTLAVENLPRTCLGRNSQEMKQLLSADDTLRVCFDTNHLLAQPAKEFILDIGDRIITTHFSDYDFRNERHWLPGEGKIDWIELVEALEEVSYSGPILYETSFTPPSTLKSRVLTIWDFKENHYRLKNKLPIEPIGTPNLENQP